MLISLEKNRTQYIQRGEDCSSPFTHEYILLTKFFSRNIAGGLWPRRLLPSNPGQLARTVKSGQLSVGRPRTLLPLSTVRTL